VHGRSFRNVTDGLFVLALLAAGVMVMASETVDSRTRRKRLSRGSSWRQLLPTRALLSAAG